MENHFKTELESEVASNAVYGRLLGTFWARIGVAKLGPFSQIGDPKLVQIRLHRQSRLRLCFWTVSGRNLCQIGDPNLV